MIKGAQLCFVAGFAVLVVLFAFSSPMAGMNRPLEVPQDYVITPFGYFHPSCVLMVAEGETLLADGSVRHADGTVEGAHICNYPHYTAGGAIVAADAKARKINPLEIDGWVESISVTTNTS
jgi:hypothetical protein